MFIFADLRKPEIRQMAELFPGGTGEVATIGDALSEPDSRIVQILYNSTDPKCNAGHCYQTGDDY